MTKYKEIYGVDISRDVFDVLASLNSHTQFKNAENGFNAFAKALPKNVSIVMKTTAITAIVLHSFI